VAISASDVTDSIWTQLFRMPFSQRWIDADGVSTRVVQFGSPAGRPLVFLHGIGGHLESFARNVEAHTPHHRVILYDLPGHGLSGAPERSYEIGGYVSHLAALLDALGIEVTDLSGLSLGGWIAARFAKLYPDRVRRLVLTAPGGITFNHAQMQQIRRTSKDPVQDATADSVRKRLEWVMARPERVTDDLVACRLAIYSQPDAVQRMERILCLQDPETRQRNLQSVEDWAGILAPTLVIWGEQDGVVPRAVGEKATAWIPGRVFSVIEDAGHWSQFEQPETYNALHLAHLQKGSTKR
jgi:2-hydroxy-6-oxonona-2,4-dienedioate hydrolase